MIGIKILKKVAKGCIAGVDLCLAVPIALCIPFVAFMCKYLTRVGKEFVAQQNILFLSGGATVEDCYKKFGSLEPLFNYDGPITSFDRVILFWYPVKNNLTISVRSDYIINERRGIRFFNLMTHLLLLLEFLSVVKKKSIKVVRAFDPFERGLMAWALSRITRIPCCVSLHADYEKRESLQGGVIPRILGSKAFASRVEQFVYHHVDLILPIRESLAEKVKAKGGTTRKIRIFPHGVDLSAFSFLNSLEWLSGKERLSGRKIISIVCRLEKENYTTDVLSVAEILSKRREDNIFLIAGDGRQMESMKAQIILRGLAERVLLLGFIPMEQVVSLRQNSFLSLCLMGGFSLIEACAAGRPVISYDVEWHSELVHNNETGFLIPEGDVAEVVGRIEYLLDHPCIADEMGEKARSLAWKHHSRKVTTHVKEAIYGELLAMNKRGLRSGQGTHNK